MFIVYLLKNHRLKINLLSRMLKIIEIKFCMISGQRKFGRNKNVAQAKGKPSRLLC